MSDLTNTQALKNGLKKTEEKGILAHAILRERLIALVGLGIRNIKTNPENYNNFFFNSEQYLEVLETFYKEINFPTDD